jgi:hypothetical protein
VQALPTWLDTATCRWRDTIQRRWHPLTSSMRSRIS